MKIKTILAALTMLISSSAAFANAPMPFDLRAGHGVVYVEWKISALPTDSVDVSTPDGTKLGVVKALPGKTKQLTLALLHNSKAGQQSLRRRFRSVDLLSYRHT